ncbi:MAG TPA: Ltp family lipoprotein [Candidatus Rothia avicola]|uniref:Ltp family lipoprotein n=1 Tax=Candidatus Rothia avicola TaxID=2840478 RepID=A0A9D1ZRH2_9MICC|nr:Ltp family lipoprotein [Candidatus Rothia avicola]
MNENPYTPNTPPSQPDHPGGPSSPAGAYAAPGQQPYQGPYGAAEQPKGKKPKNVVGLVALGLGVLGFILGCIPAVMLLGWLLLFAAFVTGIVGLFQKNKEKVTSIIAIALSVIGSVISGIVLFFFALNTIANDSELQQSLQELESAVASPSATAPAAASTAPSAEAPQQTKPTAGDVPRDYTSALAEARDYLKVSNFSYAGLYDQLTSEYGGQYSPEAAQYAMDNLSDVDWNAEALEAAEDYIEFSDFSYAGLYDQLTSEYGSQFTPEQAQYAVDNVNADWNQEALDAARSYLEISEMSDARLFDQLTSEYGSQFTPEQAQYAIDNL